MASLMVAVLILSCNHLERKKIVKLHLLSPSLYPAVVRCIETVSPTAVVSLLIKMQLKCK